MKNIVLNDGYLNLNFFFSSEKNDRKFIKEKSYIDLSNCAYCLILEHNNSLCKNKIKQYLNNNVIFFAYLNVYAIKLLKNIKKFKIVKKR